MDGLAPGRRQRVTAIWVQHRLVPTECASCGAAEFSDVVEVIVKRVSVMHWVRPAHGWYLLREQRPREQVALITARCERCVTAKVERAPLR